MLEPATEEFKEEVCQKFNTSLKQVQKDVEVLKEWIRQQPHLPQCSSDTLLTTFLIACKNSMERAKEKIEKYYESRSTIPDFFGDRDPEHERAQTTAKEIKDFFLPKLTPEGYRVHIAAFNSDVKSYDMPAYIKRAIASEDIKFHTESFCLGEYAVIDSKLFTASHLLRVTPTMCMNFMYCIQDSLPVMVKGIIFFNTPTYMEVAVNIMRPFMKKKFLQRIHVHTEGPVILEKYFPRKMLPRDYGGEEETSDVLHEQWTQLLREKRDWLIGEGSLTVDEKKRIGGARKNKGLEEMQGSFKALCVD